MLIDRLDRNPGDFDVESNYDQIVWEIGDASGGVNGLGGQSARVGFSNGIGAAGTFFELTGSGVPGYFLDGSLTSPIFTGLNNSTPGRWVFSVIHGDPVPVVTPALRAPRLGGIGIGLIDYLRRPGVL